MRTPFGTLRAMVMRDGSAALVSVVGSRGSAPREAGARMVVTVGGEIAGTVGGGRLELEAVEIARSAAAARRDDFRINRFALGPALGQCCGGHMSLAIEAFTEARAADLDVLAAAEAAGPFASEATVTEGSALHRRIVPRDAGPPGADLSGGLLRERFGRALRPLQLFGAGHVGRAVVMALAPLPFAVTWIDERPEMFPKAVPAGVRLVATTRPQDVPATAEADAFTLVMTHDHALDLEIMHAVLGSGRSGFVGLIGSATKRARFENRLLELGHPREIATRFRCPIGVGGLRSKEPAHIAAAVAFELLLEDETALAMPLDERPRHVAGIKG